MNIFDNVAFGLRERKLNRLEIQRKVADALKQVDLEGTAERRPSQLSGGQQQRVALARTLVIQPRVLLLDEPLSNLDAKLRVEMRLELLKLQRDLGLTTIYVTHDQEEALAMSTRIAVMKTGKIVQQGNPREVYERPADEFVATFVGQANFFSGRVAHCAGHIIDVALDDGVMIRAALSSLPFFLDRETRSFSLFVPRPWRSMRSEPSPATLTISTVRWSPRHIADRLLNTK